MDLNKEPICLITIEFFGRLLNYTNTQTIEFSDYGIVGNMLHVHTMNGLHGFYYPLTNIKRFSIEYTIKQKETINERTY